MGFEKQNQDIQGKVYQLVKMRDSVGVYGIRGFPMIEGGVETHCEALYSLMSKDFDFVIFRRKPWVRSKQQWLHIKFIDLPSTRIPGWECLLHSFLAAVILCFSSVSIVHIHNIGPGIFAPLLRLRGKKVILTYHSANYEHDKLGKLSKLCLRISEKIALRCAHRIIFVNRFQMEKYSHAIRAKSVFIPNGVTKKHPIETMDYIRSLGLVRHKYILTVGRLVPEKGYDLLIRSFEMIDTDFKLVIVGNSENAYRWHLESLVQSGRVVFTDYLSGELLSEVYTHAALFVLPSFSEGFPIVLLEAMEYGLDVLVSDIPATHLVSLEKEDYFVKGDAYSLAERLQQKIMNFRRRKYNLSAYNWEKRAEQGAGIYSELLNKILH